MIVTQVEEVQSELGGPDCKLTEPFVYDQENDILSPWLLNVTTQNTFMISSDKILTLVYPNCKWQERNIQRRIFPYIICQIK